MVTLIRDVDGAVREAAVLAEASRWEEAIALLRRLLRSSADEASRTRLQLALVRVYNEEDWTRGLCNRAVKHAILDDIDGKAGLPEAFAAEALYLRGAVLHVDFIMDQGGGDPEREIACFTRATELFGRLGDTENAALATAFIGIFHHVDRLDRDTAEPILRRAYEMAPTTGGSYAKAEAARHLGQIQQERGEPAGALELLDESLQLQAEARLPPCHLAAALHAIGFARLEAGDISGADNYLRRAREVAERYGARFFLGLIARTEADLALMRLTGPAVHRRTHP
jgi:tetratricopeptide (TPR) repeat protein